MDVLIILLIVLFILLVIVTLVGHGIWLALAWIFGAENLESKLPP